MKRLVLPLDHGAHRAHKGASPDEGYGDDGKHHDDGLVEHRATPNGKKRYGGKPPELRREHQDEKESDNELGCSHNSKRKRTHNLVCRLAAMKTRENATSRADHNHQNKRDRKNHSSSRKRADHSVGYG